MKSISSSSSHESCLFIIAGISLCFARCGLSEQPNNSSLEAEADTLSYADVQAAHYELSKSEEMELIAKANKGDMESSFRLSQCYGRSRHWYFEYNKWLVIAAEQGLDVAAYNLALNYSNPGSEQQNLERAKYWMEIANQRGMSKASEELARIEELIKEEKILKAKLQKLPPTELPAIEPDEPINSLDRAKPLKK